MQQNKDYDPLVAMRRQTKDIIKKNWPSIEKFCFEQDLDKGLISKFLNGKRSEFRIETLKKIACAVGKKLKINYD